MITTIHKFLESHHTNELPLLLAFSGGPDSLALLHLLIEVSRKRPLKLALAHVDHGWREESKAEADQIVQMAEKLKFPLHLRRLDPKQMSGNLENACRDARYQFFSELCHEYGYQAVLVGHHADDLAETVLKRTLEGVTIPYLSGFRSETVLYGINVWRPLLSISKAQIVAWLNEKGLKGFQDSTNDDTSFLRARFRVNVLPYLNETFGKNVSSGLCRIAEEAGELRDYLDAKIEKYLNRFVEGKLGGFLDLSDDYPAAAFELKYLIRQFCKNASFSLSRECIDKAAEFIMQKTANKFFVVGEGDSLRKLYLDRGRLFIPSKKLSTLSVQAIKVRESKAGKLGFWKIDVVPCEKPAHLKSTTWQDIWLKGRGSVVLPRGDYEVAFPGSFKEKTLLKVWSDQKVPAFFRQEIPVIFKEGKIIHEFLTGKYKVLNEEFVEEWIQVSICLE